MSLPPLIAALLSPAAFPERPDIVKLVQTHISYVFILPDVVYKIKKPVNLGFLDFTTLEKRRFFCEEEARLNSRLGPDVYIGVVPITFSGGKAQVNGLGAAVEYAVKMRRISDKRLLVNMVKEGTVTPEQIRRVAVVIAAFHKDAQTDERIAAFGEAGMIEYNATENFEQTARFAGTIISTVEYERIKAYTMGFIGANAALFASRVKNGFIRDCHGDIHSEHVSIDAKVEIIDCIEFNERFRFSDCVADAAFLSMDLDYLGRHDLAEVFDAAYLSATGDGDGRCLLGFYKCYRAYVRGKVAGIKYLEPEVGKEEALAAYIEAKRHFALALQYAEGVYRPSLVVVAGLSGTGKTTLANAISKAADMPVLSSDVIRKQLAGLRPEEHGEFAYGAGIYTPEFTAKTYSALIDRAGQMLKTGRPVIIEATFARRRHLIEALEAAKEAGADVYIIECRAADGTVMRNMSERAKAGTVSDAGYEVYKRQKEGFEEIDQPHLPVEVEAGVKRNLQRALEYIFSLPSSAW